MNPFSRIADAAKLSIDQLKEAMERKTLPAYIAIPLIEEKMDMQNRMQNMMAMQQAQQQQPPIAQQIMQRAAMEEGINRLPSNLPPAGMAGGGIVAFQEGGLSQEEELRRAYEAQGIPFDPRLIQKPAPMRLIPSPQAKPLTEADKNFIARTEGITLGAPKPLEKPAAPKEAQADAVVEPPQQKPPAPSEEKRTPMSFAMPSVTAALSGVLDKYRQQSVENQKSLMEGLNKNRLEGKAFQEYESMLRKEAEQAGVDKDRAKSMAIFKAGLAMMAGTHPNALVNIGQGAMVGAEDYQKATEQLRKAERQRIKEFGFIEQARRAEAKNDFDRRDNMLMKAYEANQNQANLITNAIVKAQITDIQQAGALSRAVINGEFRAMSRGGAGLTQKQAIDVNRNALKILKEEEPELYERAKAIVGVPPKTPNTDPAIQETYKKLRDARYDELTLGAFGTNNQEDKNPHPGFSNITPKQ